MNLDDERTNMNLTDDHLITAAAKELYDKVPAAAQAQGLEVASIDELPNSIPDGYRAVSLVLTISQYETDEPYIEPKPNYIIPRRYLLGHIKAIKQLNPYDITGKEHLDEVRVDVFSWAHPQHWKDNKIYMGEMTLDCVGHEPGFETTHAFIIGRTLIHEDILAIYPWTVK